ncbi:hypothetical protein DMB37_31030 [Nocardia sp. CS682]|nr:hypothetical protein DMB37_31030 [Nocardia sp. CS682]
MSVTLDPFQVGTIEYCLIRAKRNDVYDSITAIFGKMDTTAAFALAAFTVDRSVAGGRLKLAGKTKNLVDKATRTPTEIREHIGNQIEVKTGEYYCLASLLLNYNTVGDYPIVGMGNVSGKLPASVDSDFPFMYGFRNTDTWDFPDSVDMSTLATSTKAPWLAFSKMPKG